MNRRWIGRIRRIVARVKPGAATVRTREADGVVRRQPSQRPTAEKTTVRTQPSKAESKEPPPRASAERISDGSEPGSYAEWLSLLNSRGARYCRYEELTSRSEGLRVFLRHDVDLFDPELLRKCASVEEKYGAIGNFFFLPPRDKRYRGREAELRTVVRELHGRGHVIGYHVNAWEKPGTFDLTDDPLGQIDYDLDWFREACGEPIRVAAAHGLTYHVDCVTNLSMYEPLRDRGVALLDPYVIRGGRDGRRIPQHALRAPNPLLPDVARIAYVGDSGGPLRKVWNDLDSFMSLKNVVINTHCCNYDVTRPFSYRTWNPRLASAFLSGRRLEVVAWMVGNAVGERTLEVGCGNGAASILLARDGRRALGIERKPAAIEHVRGVREEEPSDCRERLSFEVTDLRDIIDREFDSILLPYTLAEDEDPAAVLREASRLLASDGRVLIAVPYGCQVTGDLKRTFYASDLIALVREHFQIHALEVIAQNLVCVAGKEATSGRLSDLALVTQIERVLWEAEREVHRRRAA